MRGITFFTKNFPPSIFKDPHMPKNIFKLNSYSEYFISFSQESENVILASYCIYNHKHFVCAPPFTLQSLLLLNPPANLPSSNWCTGI